jgi:hypothetical protein
LDSQLGEAKVTVDKWHEYKNAKAHLDELESKPLPSAVKDAQIPGITAIAIILEAEGEQVGAMMFFFVFGFCGINGNYTVFFLGE